MVAFTAGTGDLRFRFVLLDGEEDEELLSAVFTKILKWWHVDLHG